MKHRSLTLAVLIKAKFMPEFEEQLRIISELREKRRQTEESLYRARVELHRTTLDLHRARQEYTIVNPDRDRHIAGLRLQMTRILERLSALRDEALKIKEWFAQFAEQKRLVEHLQQNQTSVRNRSETLRRQIAELRQQDPPPAEEIERLEAALKQIEQNQLEFAQSLESAGAILNRMREQEESQSGRQAALQEQMEGLRADLRGLQGRLAELLEPAFSDPEALDGRRTQLESAASGFQADLIGCGRELSAAIGGLYLENAHPRDALSRLNDRIPFLLFPVRIETIFVPVQSSEGLPQTELWVRVYPDEIAIHTHEKILTDREIVAGELYWIELVVAEHLRGERDNRRRAAWRHLVELFGGQRASWVARQTRPSDWPDQIAAAEARTLLDFLRAADPDFFADLRALPLSESTSTALEEAIAENDGDAFTRLAESEEWFDRINAAARTRITGFPEHDLTKNDAWTRAPRTQILPDRFVLLLYQNETAAPRQIPGTLIPDTVYLGPDPLEAKDGFTKKDGALTFAGAFDWMSDFDKALEQGMGFRVRLTEEEARNGFVKIFVLGVFLSADAFESAAMLEELIDNHQYSPKGFSLVPQGTPTNNTERDGTGYSDNDPYDDLAFFTDTDPPAFDPADPDPRRSRTDGRLLADALGIGYAPLQTVQYADQTDLIEAAAMNVALFPCTLGYWLRSWMAPVITEQTARQVRSFFTRFVSGRGPLPAVRVGNQPYGILLTSDFSRWAYPERGVFLNIQLFAEEMLFLKKLHQLLLKLEASLNGLASALPFVGKPGTNSAEALMKILGLHPTSVEFYQRIGYSDEYLRNLQSFQNGGRYANELNSLIFSMPATAWRFLSDLGIEKDVPTIGKMRSLHVIWQHYVTRLDVPNLVENKPPSETDKLTINYIDWLANADSAERIINQNFDGPLPSALLYLMLRNALLLQLHHGAYDWLKERAIFDPALERSLGSTTLAGMRVATPNISKYEILTTRVEVAEPSNPLPSTTIADWVWRGPDPTEVEAAFLREQKAALPLLADAATARLERCLVEHLDCCNYRLDAWQTGLFAQRLAAHRGSGAQRQRGIYLGAFGWVESLKPARKVFLSSETLPPSLRPEDAHPILEEDEVLASPASRQGELRQGGFTHAPSINHASAAALLRNAYLSHAKPEQAEIFSVNLSSERVRRAQFILEGMRNGQPIEALLGYQFERGLHDRTSESAARGDVPVLELNRFILPYRQAFPFESREVVQVGTGSASLTVPAYTVVNGLRLTQATLSAANAYGLDAMLEGALPPDSSQGAAILSERDRLLDTLDAVKDLLLAENAFQLVRGNFDRVAAVSLAQKDAHLPPELEVINTPRGTEFTFTNRVTLHFDDLDPELPSSNPWPANPLTPRAIAETGMNKWLGSVLDGDPENIRCDAYRVEKAENGQETEHDRHPVTLGDLRVQPIDFVWMSGISPEDTGGATELETRIAYEYRRSQDIEKDKTIRIEFNPPVAAGQMTFARFFPLARHLRALLMENRALNAMDFVPAAGGKASAIPIDPDNPKGYDTTELRSRVQGIFNALVTLAESIDGASAPTVNLVFLNDPETTADEVAFSGPLGDAFTKLEEAKLIFTDATALTVSFLISDAETLRQRLRAIANFGMADAFPPEADLTSDAARAELLARAHRVARRLRRAEPKDGVLDRATAILNRATTDKPIEEQVGLLLGAGKILFGETFQLLPKFTCHNEIELSTSDASRSQLLKHAVDATPGITEEEVVEEWLQGLSRVRRQLHRWEVVRTLVDALNDVSLKIRPVQVPYRANDSWLAVELPEKDPNDKERPFNIDRDTLSIAAHGASAFQSGTRQSGVLLDDWTEEIPTGSEITGIAFRFNQPNAAPPQTLLLAVTPVETGSWDWDDLVGTLADTLSRAKRRAVEPEHLEKQGLVWNAFAPALVTEFSALAEADVSLDFMLMMNFTALNEFYTTLTRPT
jgi:hypothetical protein